MTPAVLVTGAGRGIGLELVRQYATEGWRVFACARKTQPGGALAELAGLHEAVSVHALDVTRQDEIDALARALADEPIDVLVNNAGRYGPKGLEIGQVQAAVWLQVLAVNTVAPWMVAQALLPQLLRGQARTIACIGSKVGSMADNRSGRNVPYRSSKAGLNQVVKTLAVELAGRDVKAVALHPGWVKTEMGGPDALIGVQESVRGMRRVIAALGPQQSGGFFSYDGREIPW